MLTAFFAVALLLPLAPQPPSARPRAAVRLMADGPVGFGKPAAKSGKVPPTKPKTKSGKVPQTKPKAKSDRFDLQFTCNICETRNEHSISRHAYAKGTVIVTCPSCNTTHLVADNLNWIEDDFKNLEEYMAKQGTPVTRVVRDGVAAEAAAAAAPPEDEEAAAPPPPPSIPKIDGIDDDQAARIREAVRANKRRNREPDQ